MLHAIVPGSAELMFPAGAFIGIAPLFALLHLRQIILMATRGIQAEGMHQILPLFAMRFDAAPGIQTVHDVMCNFMRRSACAKVLELAAGDLQVVTYAGVRPPAILSGSLTPQIEADFRCLEALPVQLFRHGNPVPGNMQ